jgi:hypothetical protein
MQLLIFSGTNVAAEGDRTVKNDIQFIGRVELIAAAPEKWNEIDQIWPLIAKLAKKFPEAISVIKHTSDVIDIMVKPTGAPLSKIGRDSFGENQYHLIFKKSIYGVAYLEVVQDSIVGDYKLSELADYCHAQIKAGNSEFANVNKCFKLSADYFEDRLYIKFSPTESIQDDEEYADLKIEFRSDNLLIFIESGDDDYGSKVLYKM